MNSEMEAPFMGFQEIHSELSRMFYGWKYAHIKFSKIPMWKFQIYIFNNSACTWSHTCDFECQPCITRSKSKKNFFSKSIRDASSYESSTLSAHDLTLVKTSADIWIENWWMEVPFLSHYIFQGSSSESIILCCFNFRSDFSREVEKTPVNIILTFVNITRRHTPYVLKSVLWSQELDTFCFSSSLFSNLARDTCHIEFAFHTSMEWQVLTYGMNFGPKFRHIKGFEAHSQWCNHEQLD